MRLCLFNLEELRYSGKKMCCKVLLKLGPPIIHSSCLILGEDEIKNK